MSRKSRRIRREGRDRWRNAEKETRGSGIGMSKHPEASASPDRHCVGERRDQGDARLPRGRTDRQRATRRGDRLFEVALLAQRMAQINKRIDEVGLERDDAAIALDRDDELAIVLKRIDEITVGVGEVGRLRERRRASAAPLPSFDGLWRRGMGVVATYPRLARQPQATSFRPFWNDNKPSRC